VETITAMTKILLIGGSGQFGYAYQKYFPRKMVFAPSKSDLNLESGKGIRTVIEEFSPEIIINAGAWTNVAGAESNKESAFRVNALGARAVAVEAARIGSRLIHLSTDYIFDGESEDPYTEKSKKNPLSVYGESKSLGEDYVLESHPNGAYIVRTSWLYGNHGQNFVKSILKKLITSNDDVTVVDDQFGSPTFVGTLCDSVGVLEQNRVPPGIYHVSNRGITSWYEFAQKVATLSGFSESRITPVLSSEVRTSLRRPQRSPLDLRATEKALELKFPDWQESLAGSIDEIKEKVKRETASDDF